jgi:hypothetical protein
VIGPLAIRVTPRGLASIGLGGDVMQLAKEPSTAEQRADGSPRRPARAVALRQKGDQGPQRAATPGRSGIGSVLPSSPTFTKPGWSPLGELRHPGGIRGPRGRHDPLVRHIMRLVATDVTGVNPSESSGAHYSQATPRVSRPHHRGWSEPHRATYRNGDFSRGSRRSMQLPAKFRNVGWLPEQGIPRDERTRS